MTVFGKKRNRQSPLAYLISSYLSTVIYYLSLCIVCTFGLYYLFLGDGNSTATPKTEVVFTMAVLGITAIVFGFLMRLSAREVTRAKRYVVNAVEVMPTKREEREIDRLRETTDKVTDFAIQQQKEGE